MNYTIIHVNDRAKESIDKNKAILSSFKYIDDIEFFNGNDGNAWDVLNHKKFKTDVWSPYDGRTFPPLPGEYGVWVSLINVWEYVINNSLESILVLEDDVSLNENFVDLFNDTVSELPNSFDFLSLYYFSEQNANDESVEIGLKNIQKANNQYSAGQATLYSYHGCKKLLKLAKIRGIEYTTDCFIFNKAHEGSLEGYSIKQKNDYFLKHEYIKVKSLIDPDNKRDTADL